MTNGWLSVVDALVVDDGAKKAAVHVNPVVNRGGGRKQYDVYAPSNPQTVNQYVHSYSYGPGKAKPRRDYSAAMQAAARTYYVTAVLMFADGVYRRTSNTVELFDVAD